jgi:hypothetical protein
MRTRRATLAALAVTAAGVALFAWLVYRAGLDQIWAGLRAVGWGLAIIIAIAGGRFALRALAWSLCLEPPHRLRWTTAFGAVIAGDTLGNATPLGPIVGEPAKAALVREQIPLRAAFTALAVENVLYSLSVAAMIAAGTIALLLYVDVVPQVRVAGEIAIAVIFVVYVAVVWALWRQPLLLSRMLRGAACVFSSPALQGRIAKVEALERDVYSFAARRRGVMLPLALIELAFHALGVLEIHITMTLLLGAAPPLLSSFILETVNRLITVLFKFVPTQVGVNHAATAYTTQILGFGAGPGITLAIVRSVRVLFWTLPGTVLLVRHGLSTRRILADAELGPSTRA